MSKFYGQDSIVVVRNLFNLLATLGVKAADNKLLRLKLHNGNVALIYQVDEVERFMGRMNNCFKS